MQGSTLPGQMQPSALNAQWVHFPQVIRQLRVKTAQLERARRRGSQDPIGAWLTNASPPKEHARSIPALLGPFKMVVAAVENAMKGGIAARECGSAHLQLQVVYRRNPRRIQVETITAVEHLIRINFKTWMGDIKHTLVKTGMGGSKDGRMGCITGQDESCHTYEIYSLA